ncbi:MAG: hypothetical protein ACRC6A_11315, partial [Fusobacteriaceae bacterium]
TLIDSETRYVIDWYLTTSREATSAFHLFDKVKKRFGAPKSIVSDRLILIFHQNIFHNFYRAPIMVSKYIIFPVDTFVNKP